MFLATPDFGATANVIMVLFGIGLVVLLGCIASVIRGVILLSRPSTSRQWSGIVLIAAGVLLPLCCYTGPGVLFRLTYGTPPLRRYPIDRIQNGMSADDVRASLGPPHHIDDQNPDRIGWTYYLDSLGLYYCKVHFDPDGKVNFISGN